MSFRIGERVRILTEEEAGESNGFTSLYGGYIGIVEDVTSNNTVIMKTYNRKIDRTEYLYPTKSYVKREPYIPDELFEI